MRDSVVISGSTDRTLKVWNADSGECVHTLYGHTSTVRCMHLHGNRYGLTGAVRERGYPSAGAGACYPQAALAAGPQVSPHLQGGEWLPGCHAAALGH